MTAKRYINANALLRDSFALARRIFESGLRPDLLVAVGRGGSPVGMAVHEFFAYKGVRMRHATVSASSYRGIHRRGRPDVDGLRPLLTRIQAGARVLVIDDIFDTGRTLEAVTAALRRRTPRVTLATVYYRPRRNAAAGSGPDFFLRTTDRWVVFPHELVGLSHGELRRKGLRVHELVGDPGCFRG